VAKGRSLRARPSVSAKGKRRACGYAKWVTRRRFWCFPRRALLVVFAATSFSILCSIFLDLDLPSPTVFVRYPLRWALAFVTVARPAVRLRAR
jgi:hypothetical protein